MKICSKCHQSKDESEFYKNRSRKGGVNHYCKKCQNASIQQARRKHRATARKASKNWIGRNPEKKKAHNIIMIEIRSGRLFKSPCWCGEKKVQAHHEDYSKPLDVVWLCSKHHSERHASKNR